MAYPSSPGPLLVAKIVRDVLTRQPFESVGDLKDAVRRRCIELRITCEPDALDRALDLVGSNCHLVQRVSLPAARSRAAVLPPPQVIQHTEASRILHALGIDVRGSRLQRRNDRPGIGDQPDDFPALIQVR